MARTPGSPTSLVNPDGETSDSRRALVTDAANSPPTADTFGFPTRCHRWLHVEVKVTGGTGCDWKLWTMRTGLSAEWCEETEVGTVSVTTATNPEATIVEIVGTDKVYIELLNLAGGPTEIEVWLGTSGDVEGR